MPSERALGKPSVERTLIRCVSAFVPCSSTVLHNLQSAMQDNGVGETLLSATHRRCMLEELDCNCRLHEGMENHPKQPQRVLLVEELQSGFVMKRRKDNPRILNCQAPTLHLLYGLSPHTTLRTLQAVVGRTTN